ncbi:uncharacterized protein [Paramisgurnus dabryanus]|uniref:uncharacterized protein n=1 Tax=Paramisgurnus dabryanus TaxID=90735 RepID=UPI0031F39F54
MSRQLNVAQEMHRTAQDSPGPSKSGRDVSIEPEASPQAGRSSRTVERTPRRKRPSPRTPQRRSPPSPASSYASASPGIPDIKKWTVLGLKVALENADIPFSRKQTKAQLFSLLRDSQRATQPPQTAVSASSDSSSSQARSTPYSRKTPGKTRRSQRRHMKPSASLGRPPMSPAASPQARKPASQPDSANMLPLTATASLLPLPFHSPGQWPAAPPSICHTGLRSAAAPAASIFHSHIFPTFTAGADTSVRMPPLTSKAPVFAAGADTSVRMPPLTSQAPAPSMTFPPDIFAHGSTQSVRLPPQAAPVASFSVNSVPQTLQPFTLATAAPMPIPPNALALEPPPVINSIRQQILAELTSYPNANFTSYLLNGLSQGFNPGVLASPTLNMICPNLQSALVEPETVDLLIHKEVNEKFIMGPFSAPPFSTFRVSPIGVATRKFSGKKRPIFDLSSPHSSPLPSINSLIPLEEFSLNYHDIDQAITLIKNAGRSAWMAKVDITSAFKIMPIHPDFWHLFGICWRNKFYFSVRLTFRCRSSPKIFDMLSEAICWILSNNYAIPHVVHLLDDFLIISPPDNLPAAHLSTVQGVFQKLGIPLAQEKTASPDTSIEFLGIILDSKKFQASLPKEKIVRIISVASNLLDNPSCSKRKLLSVLGYFNFAMRIIPQGRPFISHLISLSTTVNTLKGLISLDEPCLNELSLWVRFLKQWNGISFFYESMISHPTDIQLYTDATPSIGFGGYYRGRWFASTWPNQLSDLPETLSSSVLFELYPIVVAAFLWGKEWTSTSIVIHCDSQAAVQCINKGRSHSLTLMPLLRRLIWTAACDQFLISATYIPGRNNTIADSLSRFAFQKFRQLAPEADLHPTPVPPYSTLIFP